MDERTTDVPFLHVHCVCTVFVLKYLSLSQYISLQYVREMKCFLERKKQH